MTDIDFYIPSGAHMKIGEVHNVIDAIDGDTVIIAVIIVECRLIGIDAPEIDEFYYSEATDKLKSLVVGKSVVFERDIEDTDYLGRPLRYLYVDGLFVNLEMVRLGYAYASPFEPNTEYQDIIQDAENEAIRNGLGIWE